MSAPRTIIETVTTEWIVITGPRDCTCGHQHYGRGRRAWAMAPQWQWCEDEACNCGALRPGTASA